MQILLVVGIFMGTIFLMLAVAAAIALRCAMITQAAKAANKSHAQMRQFEKSWAGLIQHNFSQMLLSKLRTFWQQHHS
jgi:uncharacterized membrane protein